MMFAYAEIPWISVIYRLFAPRAQRSGTRRTARTTDTAAAHPHNPAAGTAK